MDEIDFDDVKPRIREAVKEFIESVAEDVVSEGYRIPEKDILLRDESTPEVHQIVVPRELITLYSNRQDEFFRDVAEWLIDSGNAFPKDDSIDDEEIPTSVLGDKADLPSERESETFHHENVVFNFAGDVLNYIGDVEFDEKAFDVAFKNEFRPNYETGLRSYEIVIPLVNFTGPRGFDSDENIPLNSDIEIHHRGTYHRVDSVSLSTLDEETADALRTFEYNYRHRNPSDLINSGQWAIYAEVSSSTYNTAIPHKMMDAPGEQLGKRIVTALRLFGPKKGSVGFDRAFELSFGWQTYRLGIPEVLDLDEGGREPSLSRESYSLTEDDQAEFQNLWSQLCSEIRLDPGYELSTSLRRFNEMYVKPYPGDRLLDCMIACEGLLLRGPHPGTKKSRMSLRASLLLDEFAGIDRRETRELIKTAYEHRGKLVHEDEYLTDILNPGVDRDSKSFVHAEEYLTQLRELLANVILAYLRATSNNHPVSELNQELDNALRDAQFNLGES
jgi:hypothetical protein